MTTARRRVRVIAISLASALLAVAAFSAVGTGSADASAQQRTLFDFTGSQTESSYWEPAANQPADYTAPQNYAEGRVYVRLDVTRKPSSLPVRALLCLWRHEGSTKFKYETCRGQGLEFTDEGVYYADLGAPASWWKKGGVYDWRQQASVVRIMIADLATGQLLLSSKCGAACFKGDVTQHVPIEFRGEVIMVPKGQTLTPPARWQGSCPSSWSPSCSGGGGTTTTTIRPTTTTTNSTSTTTSTSTSSTTTTSSITTTTAGPPTTPPPGESVLLVTGSGRIGGTDRDLAQAISAASGRPVTPLADTAITPAQADAAPLVVISSSVQPSEVPDWLADVNTPMVLNEVYVWDNFGLATRPKQLNRQRNLEVTGSGPLAAGLSGQVAVTDQATQINAALPGSNAQVIASTGNGHASIFAFSRGATLTDGSTAPARRVAFFQAYPTPPLTSDDGDALLRAAITWAMG